MHKNLLICALVIAESVSLNAADNKGPVKVFVIAGDENCLEQGVVAGRTEGTEVQFFPDVVQAKDEKVKHVNCAVYKGGYDAGTDYDKITPEVAALVEIGDQRTERRADKQKGRIPVPMTPFPELVLQEGYTTVLRGALAVTATGQYEVMPGGFNVTIVDGKEVFRSEAGQDKPVITPIQLEAKKRYSFTTVFFQKPVHEFRVPMINRPGALETVIVQTNQYAFLRKPDGQWARRDDVILYDAHPIHNNTRAPGLPLGIPDDPKDPRYGVSPDLMFGNVMGDNFEEPVFLLRFATKHPIWFMRGSRSLGHDYMPPSSGGDPAKYPEFAGNVKSVDTQPFLRGGDPRTFGNNSETILEVGDTLGRAMLELMKADAGKNRE